MAPLWRKVGALLRRDAMDAELQEEMRTHIEMRGADGDPDVARRQFGNATQLLEESRAAWGWPRLESWLRDLRYALRVLWRRPAFSATVVLTLALGIGSSSLIFSLIDTVLIRPLPYPKAERLVSVQEAKESDNQSRTRVSPGRLADWDKQNSTFDGIAGSYQDTLTETSGPAPERIAGAYVSPGFFSVMGTKPEVGRTFAEQEEAFGGPLSIVISDGYWRRRFSADPEVLGRTVMLSGVSHVVVGVMPPSFQYPAPIIEVWAAKQASPDLMRIREARFYAGVGRLKTGVTPEQARTDLATIQRRLGEQYPKTDAGWGAVVEPLKDEIVGGVRLALWLLTGSVGLLLLIACANVACLMLAQLNGRTAEIALRSSLGAGRVAIARQLFAEGLVYALAGGALGALGAFAGMDLLRKQVPDVPRITELAVDYRTLALMMAVSVLSAILFSLAPVMQMFRQVALRPGGRGVVGTRQRLPRILVSAQLALATTLLIGAGLFLRSLLRLEETPLGFRTENVLTLRVAASSTEAVGTTIQRHQRSLEALAAVPGASSVAMATGLPGANPTWTREFQIAGEPPADSTLQFAGWRIVTTGYFQTMDIPILAGRTCRMDSGVERPFETLVNRKFVERYFPGRDPIGRAIAQGPHGYVNAEIVGIVADVREDGHGREPQPVIYACGYLRYFQDSDFLVQFRNRAGAALAVREALRAIDPGRPIYGVRWLNEAHVEALAQTRFRTLLISLFSMLALTLAAVGLYGVMAYMVSQRTREIGVRVALGARPGQILGEIVRSGSVLAGAGAAAGIVLAFALSRVMATLLYGIGASDVTTYVYATAVLLGVAMVACLIPGGRATSVDPTQALREQ